MNDVVELSPKGIFLSYSSQDRDAALRLKGGLEELGVSVRLDQEAMQPGQRIRAFIFESIQSTCATVLIVSEASLVSDWVALEVGTSLVSSDVFTKRKFIACYLDEGFLDDGFRERATQTIDARIAKLNQRIVDYVAKTLDTVDLDSQKSRLYDLRATLGKILARLRAELCLDLRADQFAFNLKRLAGVLRPLVPGQAPAPLSAASDVEERAKEIYDLVANADGDRALRRIMDFLRDFSDDKRRLREITVAIGEFRRLEKEEKRTLRELHRVRTTILSHALEIVDDTIETLSRRVA